MYINKLHGFDLTHSEAISLQSELSLRVYRDGGLENVSLIAGVDVSVGRWGESGRAAVVLLEYPSLEVVAKSIHEGPVPMPYIPGLLSFRELPLILPAFENLGVEPDLIIVDGQGIAHPRRFGIASHLGLFTNLPTIGCAKSRLCGEHAEVGNSRGSSNDLSDHGEIIGRVIRTKEGSKPLFVSAGHRLSLETAAAWVLKLSSQYRLPEPVRQAHLAADRRG